MTPFDKRGMAWFAAGVLAVALVYLFVTYL